MPFAHSVLAAAVAATNFSGLPQPDKTTQTVAVGKVAPMVSIPDQLETRSHAKQWLHYAINKSRTTGPEPKPVLNREQAGIIDQELDNIEDEMTAAPHMADCTGVALAIRDTTRFSNNVTYAMAHLSLRPAFNQMQMSAHIVYAEAREDEILPELQGIFRQAKRRMIENRALVGRFHGPIDSENCTARRPIEGFPDMAGMK